jgi:hypothetical protein
VFRACGECCLPWWECLCNRPPPAWHYLPNIFLEDSDDEEDS